MAFLLLLVALCAATVFVTVGSWSRLVRTPLRSRWLLVPAIGIPIALRFIDLPANAVGTWGFGLFLGAYGLLLTFCFLNLSVRGMAVVAVGVALNAFVIGLNHGMPTVAVDDKPVTPSALHIPRSDTDILPMLGDAIVMPITRETISFGDLIIAVGLMNVVFWASRTKKRGSSEPATETATTDDTTDILGPPLEPASDALLDDDAGEPMAAAVVDTTDEVPTVTLEDAPEASTPADDSAQPAR